MTLKYFARDTAGNSSAVATQAYVLDNTAPSLTITPANGAYASGQLVTMTAGESGSTIYYTTDGSNPGTAAGGSTKAYTAPFAITGNTTVKALAVDAFGNSSAVATRTYTVLDTTPPVVTVNPPAGSYPANQQITLTANETATIYYTTNGSTPTTASTKYTAPIILNGPLTLKYFAVDGANNSSAVVTQTYSTGPDVTKPIVTANPASGEYAAGTNITLTANEAAEIRYTKDGTDPLTAGLLYTAPITFTGPGPMTLKYFAKDTAGNTSDVATQTYTIPPDTTAPVITANPTGRALASGATITLSANETATIYYTTDGSTPTTTESATNLKYTVPLVMGSSTLTGMAKIGGVFPRYNRTGEDAGTTDMLVATVDVGSNATKTNIVINTPFSGALRVRNFTFGTRNWGPCALDDISFYRVKTIMRDL